MKKGILNKSLVISIMLLFIGTFLPVSGTVLTERTFISTSSGNTFYVGGNGTGNYTRIQNAIDNASNGDTVFVYDDSSPYYENVIIDKSINLIGKNRDTTVIDGGGNGNVVYVSADRVNISGFTIRNSGYPYRGISMKSNYNNITGNNISNNGAGIFLYESSGNTVTGNNISNNRYGIRLREFSSNNIITGNNISNHERGISLESSGNTVTGNNISNNGFGIRIYSSSGSTVMDNNISNNWDGIYLKYSSGNNITGNTISNNENGICLLRYSSNNIITCNNIISNNGDGIYLYSSGTGNNNIISDNSFFNDSLYVYDSYQNTVFNNTVNGKPLVYLEDESDLVIDDAGQIILIKCDNITVQNQELSTSIGIWLWDTNNCLFSGNTISSGLFLISSSNNNTITGNNISNNRYGIHLESSNNNTITGNNISNNRYGIRLLYSSSNNNITGNNISNNDDGIYLHNSSYNTIYNNYFNNTNNIYDGGNNIWNISKTMGINIIGGPYLGGNHWSDYTGVDLDGDGLGDTDLPYNSSGNIHNGGDWLPLVNSPPYTPSNPDPPDGVTSVDINSDLSWDGGDPDSGDTVTYDVYFGTTSLPPKVVSNQSGTTYDPTMSYNTHYYWKIVAWDNHDARSEGPIWGFTTEEVPEPDLDCEGSLNWIDVSPGSTVTDYFTIKNIGEPESHLDWMIYNYPIWGNWSFNIECGENLTPEDGQIIINVSVVAPNVQNEEFNGSVLIVNQHNHSDYCTIDVTLATPKNKLDINSIGVSVIVENDSRSLKSVDNSEEILSWGKIAFGFSEDPLWNRYGPCYIELNDPQNITWLFGGPGGSSPFFSGGTWTNDGRWIVCEYYTGALWQVDPENGDGESIGGGGIGLNGLSYNPVNEKLYGASGSYLWKIDIETGEQELVGSFGVTTLMIGIAFDADGVLYGWDIMPDNLYTIDADTGDCTKVGPLSIDLNHTQDGAFEFEDDILYLAAYTTDGNQSLYKCDEDTGNCTLVGPLKGEFCAFAIPYELEEYVETIWYSYWSVGPIGTGFYAYGPGIDMRFREWEGSGFFSAGTWTNDGRFLCCMYGNGTLYDIDPKTFDVSVIGDGGSSLNGLAYDPVNEELYGASRDGLWIIDMETGEQEYVGGFINSVWMIGIAFDAEGTLYGWDINPDYLYTIDIETGEATAVGPLGINLNYAQDGAFDLYNDILYLAAYTLGGPYLYECDEDTGECTLIGPLNPYLHPTAWAISYELNMTPPVTNISFDPLYPDGDNGWYVSNVTVILNAIDKTGVIATYYRINGGEWQIYESSFIYISKEGSNIIEYYSVDYVGNIEDVKSSTVDIDKTPPDIEEVTWEAFQDPPIYGPWYVTFTCNATDATSGMGRVEFFINDGLHEIVKDIGAIYTFTIEWSKFLETAMFKFIFYDIAGNYAKATVNGSDINSIGMSVIPSTTNNIELVIESEKIV